VGQALSTTGSLASFIALPIFVLTLTGSSAEAGLVGFFNVGTAMAASLPGGALADRCNRRTIMLVSDLARAGGMALLAAAATAHRASLPLVLAVAAADGGLSSLFGPAEVAALRRIVDDKQLPSALATNQARTAAAALVGPPLGGFLFGLSHSLPFAVNALSYGASFFCVLLVRTPLHVNRMPGESTEARDLFAGLRFLAAHPFLRYTTLNDAVLNFSFAGILLGVIVAGVHRGSSALTVGGVIAVAGAGTLAGAAAASKVARRLSPRQAVVAIGWVCALLVPLMGLSASPLVLAAAVGLTSVLAPIETVVISASRILLTPDDLQGRVQSASGLVSMSATPLGPVVAGFLLERVGPSGMFLTFAGVLGALAVASTTSRGLRKLPTAFHIPVPPAGPTPAAGTSPGLAPQSPIAVPPEAQGHERGKWPRLR
jgi:MFS family permease